MKILPSCFFGVAAIGITPLITSAEDLGNELPMNRQFNSTSAVDLLPENSLLRQAQERIVLANTGFIQGSNSSLVLTQNPDILETPLPPQPERRGLEIEPENPAEELFQPNTVPLQQRARSRQGYRASPSISIITPSGYGKSWRTAGIGIGFQERTRFTDDADGVIGIGVGFGNARETIGVDVGLTITDLLDDFAQDGTLSIKLHRRLPEDFSVALGVQNIIAWGETDGGTSAYGVVSKRLVLEEDLTKPFSEMYLSAGIGTGQFRSESQIAEDEETIGVFGSVAMRVAPPVNVVLEWTGQDLTIGVPIVPFRNLPLVVTPAVTDITNNAGDGARFILGVGYGISFN